MSITRETWMKYDVGESCLARRTSESVSSDLIPWKGSIIKPYALQNLFQTV